MSRFRTLFTTTLTVFGLGLFFLAAPQASASPLATAAKSGQTAAQEGNVIQVHRGWHYLGPTRRRFRSRRSERRATRRYFRSQEFRRCQTWRRQCDRNWSTQSNFIGCLRFHGCE